MDTQRPGAGERTGDIGLPQIVAALRRDSKWLILFVSAVTLAALAYALLAPTYYGSRMALYPTRPDEDSPLGRLRGFASDLGFSPMGSQPDIQTSDVLASRRVRRRILEAKWETNEYPDGVDLITYWGWSDEDPAKAFDRAIRKLDRLIHVSESSTGLIEVIVEMPEPALAKGVAAFLFAATQGYIQNEVHSLASLNRSFIERRVEETRAELREAEDSLELFLDKNRRLVDSPTLQLEYDRLVREVEVRQEVFITLRQQNEIAKIAEVRETLAVNLLDPPEIPPRRSRPKRLLIVSLALLGSVALGGGTSVARRRADDSTSLPSR